MNEGIVFNIKKFAIHDGPGIRTTVFLKRCPFEINNDELIVGERGSLPGGIPTYPELCCHTRQILK